LVVAVNVADVFPAAIETLAGTTALALLLLSVTTTPPTGAASVSVIVPTDDAGPTTVSGFNTTVLTTTGRTFNVPLASTAPVVAVMVTSELVRTADVVTLKVTTFLPTGTVTLAGTAAIAGFELLS
jgi:hypothetical protein